MMKIVPKELYSCTECLTRPGGFDAMQDQIRFQFNVLKAAQAIAVLLRRSGQNSDNYTRLIKLLVKADLKSIEERGRPITGDRFYALPNGHVLTRILDLINGKDFENALWGQYISNLGRFDIELIHDPGNSELSAYEIGILEDIVDENQNKDQYELIEELHKLPEFKKNDPRLDASGPQSIPIPIEDVIDGLGLTSSEKHELLTRAKELAETDLLFARR